MDFPSLKPAQLRAVLERKPLYYRRPPKGEGQTGNGSHQKLVSSAGYPDLLWSFHKSASEIRPRTVKKILMEDVGLTEEQARKAIKGDLK